MSIGFRKILRDLWRSKGRTILAVLSIAIGVFALGAISGMNDLMPARMISSYRETNPAHIYVYLSDVVTDDDITRLARLPGVEGVEGQRGLGARWRLNSNEQWRDASIAMRGDYEHQKFNTIRLISGEWPTENGIAVDQATVDFFHVPSSGTIMMSINDRERVFKIVGVVRDINLQAPAWGGDAAFYVSKDMAETVFDASGYTSLGVQIPVFSVDAANAVFETVKAQLEKIGVPVFFFRVQDPNIHPAQETVDGVTMILGVMAILSLALGLFLVINTINAMVTQQVPQIGVMKAIGGTTRQMLTLYLSGVILYGLLALLIAVPLGALAGSALTNSLLPLMAIPPDPVLRFSQSALTQQVLVGLLVPLLAALWPVFSGVRITVREAISSYGINAGYGQGLLDRILGRLRGLPRPVALTLRNTFRRKGRVALTLITLTMAGAVFIMVMSSALSFTYTINFLTDSMGLKVLVGFQHPVRTDEAIAIIESQPNVDHAEMQLFGASTALKHSDDAKGEDIFVNAVQPDSQLIRFPIVTGRWLMPDDGHAVVLNREIADKLGVTVGDTITIKLSGGQKIEWSIVGTVFDLSNLQRNVYVPLAVYQREVGLTGRGTTAWIMTTPDDGATQLRVEQQLRDALNARGLRVGGTDTQEKIRVQNEKNFGIVTAMLLMMSALIAAVGAIGLAGTLSINVLERRREIGVMRAIGASSPTIAGLFVGEGLILGLMTWVIAVPLSYPVGQLFATMIGQAIQFGVIYQFAWNGVLVWLIIVTILSIIGSVVPAIRATRVSVRESLAYE
jgi:putative ABC transport system permease protein